MVIGMWPEELGKWLLFLGLVIAGLGGILWLWGKIPFIGRLPGDILIQRDNFVFFFPLVTGLAISLFLTLVLNLLLRFLR